MTTPDVLALQRRTYQLTLDEYAPGDQMVLASMTMPGRANPAKFMGEPEALEQLVTALDPAPVVHQVAAIIQWAAGALDTAGKADEAETARRIASFIVGDLADIVGVVTAPKACNCEDCNIKDTRECTRCGKVWCVKHWAGDTHTCAANRRRAAPPPPLVPVLSPAPEPTYR